MKSTLFFLVLIFTITSCTSKTKTVTETSVKAVYLQKDKEILEQILQLYSNEKNTATSDLIIKVGTFFKEMPYIAHTLETEPEQLIVNLREFDCTTFAENVLAVSRTIKCGTPSFEQFAKELQSIRYRNGIINGYPSRIHYFSDWIYESNKRNLIKDVSEEIANIPYTLKVNFMSTHPESYAQLKDTTLIPLIAAQEQEISKRKMYFIPEEKIVEFENLLKDGDIAGITTSIKGLDISHVVILQRVGERIHILHASQTANKVILSEETLEEYLKSSKSATGIMVARPL
ncbi:MAG: hypothetical protein FD181_953 [Prolixibacteraceae bacterium]|nr:MAG: hypothetical protein FD181_953 [Prolixibacteraceae bacterium]